MSSSENLKSVGFLMNDDLITDRFVKQKKTGILENNFLESIAFRQSPFTTSLQALFISLVNFSSSSSMSVKIKGKNTSSLITNHFS